MISRLVGRQASLPDIDSINEHNILLWAMNLENLLLEKGLKEFNFLLKDIII